MSQTQIDAVRGIYAAYGRGDINSLINALAPDVFWRLNGRRTDHPIFGDWKGREGVRDFFRGVAELQEPVEFVQREYHAAGDKVFVLGHYSWKIRKTGKTVSTAFIHIFTMAGGKVQHFEEFTDTAQYAAVHGK